MPVLSYALMILVSCTVLFTVRSFREIFPCTVCREDIWPEDLDTTEEASAKAHRQCLFRLWLLMIQNFLSFILDYLLNESIKIFFVHDS